ncbi:MAG: UbiA family prenyltransferase [Rhodanobacteraceae bacterium]|nr:UbiA family prenyltransferase [Rhodanobacteraceae bacterium]MBK7042959.1 UbiA family prenyltransferase [Rhodanobacteraceae bacterium]MBP9153767.1 UbiA family prenyltransferase [Xanthomonadales bacterium]HQW81057.1 UbiA family prenyltransferase [Pseudomonadota bacterium]
MILFLSALVRLLRPHQWAKNLLVFVAVLTAHRYGDAGAWIAAAWMFAAFCLAASAIYVINDAADVVADRAHPDKSKRPFASGALSPKLAWSIAPLLLSGAAWVGSMLPVAALSILGVYVALSLVYTFAIKRLLWLDVLVLAALYVLRVAAGAIAIAVALSPWLFAFALFLFVSLATLKRYGELAMHAGRVLDGRAYQAADAPIVLAVGAASALTAVLVFALYVQSEDVRRLYTHPELLWLVAPVLLYWLARLWTLAGRGLVRADPILFALRDGGSYLSGLALLGVFWCAL